ncbi:MAG TPA: hypothetical protein VHD87_02490 [Acidimicrobiales bacterium]|nr:hypothetical protein [Acidimicrobiales bacterium]
MDTVDPICGMTIDTARAAATRTTAGGTVYFCSPACAAAFDNIATNTPSAAAPVVAVTRARRRVGVTMLGSILLAVALLVVLLAAGVGTAALSITAGVLVLLCLASCAVAARMQSRALKEVERAANELAARRRAQPNGPSESRH